MTTLKTAFITVAALLTLSACGGGSSSSGGPSFVPITFSGTYDTIADQGDISIQLVTEATATILLTGIPCLEQVITLEYEVRGDDFNISSLIPGQPDNAITGGVAQITLLWPIGGGVGSIIIDPGSNCVPSQGSMNVIRS